MVAFHRHNPNLTSMINDVDIVRLMVMLTNGARNAGHQMLDELTLLVAFV
jgi:hypothetical protein